jgi:hypothetical protein
MKFSKLARNIASASIAAAAVALFCTSAGAQDGVPEANTDAKALAAPADDLAVTPSFQYTNAAHVAAGAGLRDVGYSTIRLVGMPADAKLVDAWLYWDFTSTPTATAPPKSPQSYIRFGKVNSSTGIAASPIITGTQIGSGADACWFGGFNWAFRANVKIQVTTLYGVGTLKNGVSASGLNGDYVVTLMRGATSSINGSNPWGATRPSTGILAEGATLVVVYKSVAEGTTGTVAIYDVGLAGTEFSSDFGYSLQSVPTPTSGVPSIFTQFGGDGQVGTGLAANPLITSDTTFLNNINIAGPGSNFLLNGDWNGSDGNSLNQLWDTHSHDVTNILEGGPNSILITTVDCLIAMGNVTTD